MGSLFLMPEGELENESFEDADVIRARKMLFVPE